MQNSRLIKLLKSLSPGELRKFLTFVDSPYFNQNERLQLLAQHLAKTAPDFSGASLDKEVVFRRLFGKKEPFQEQKVHDHASQLLRLLEDFLAQQELQADEVLMGRLSLEALEKRDMQDHFPRSLRRVQQRLEKRPPQDRRTFLHRYRLGEISAAFFQRHRKRRSDAQLDELLGEMGQNLDLFFLFSKLKDACEGLNRRNILNTSYQPEMLEEIRLYLEKPGNPYLQVPAIAIYYRIFKTLTDSEEAAHYQQLVALLEEQAGQFSPTEAHAMYTFAQNYCIKQINRGQSSYLEELFRLYRQLLDQGILIESDGYLAHWYYKNITTVGLRLQAYEWVKDFLETYKNKIHPADRENAYNYNLSAYYYEQRRYKEAMKLLQQVEFTEVNYHLSAKSLLLKIYYELEEDEALKYLIQSYQVYLKRNQDLSPAHIEGHNNLLRFVKKAYRLRRRKPQLDEAAFQARHASLTEQVNTTAGIPNANWLRAIVGEIAEPTKVE